MSSPPDEPDWDAVARAFEAAYAAEMAGDTATAVSGYHALLKIDPTDTAGVQLRLARLGAGPVPQTAPRSYVTSLFDENADEFDARLVGDLGYDVPEQMRAAVDALGPPPIARILDLGCGTGLVGAAFADLGAQQVGIDLSPGMLTQAARRQIYDSLLLGEVVETLNALTAGGAPPADLILAADLLIYIGEPRPLLAAASAALAPGGHVIASTETLVPPPDEPWTYRVGNGMRYAHDPGHIAEVIAGAGLTLRSLAPITVRMQADLPVPGHLAVGQKPL